MILRDIKTYLIANKRATLDDLVNHFHSSPEVMRDMLSHWVRKGKVIKDSQMPNCGKSCGHCNIPQIEIYEWAEKTPTP